MNELTGKNFMVIGGSSGIGLALVHILHRDGGAVYEASRTEAPDFADADVKHLPFDITGDDFSALSQFAPETLHGLVYCPGTITLRPFTRLTEKDFMNDFRLNVLGAVHTIQALIPSLKRGAPSSVVLFSTVATRVGMNFHASVASAKSAVEGLVKSLAAEYARTAIRFNVVAPSITETPLAAQLLNTQQKTERSAKRHPLERIGKPEDMAKAARFLVGQDAGWVTGQVLQVDGGLSSLSLL
ncbi:MAG TPA: SDR family oxidoreductase [bacterium]|nr:SDR family oxidoreductase [bacterium]